MNRHHPSRSGRYRPSGLLVALAMFTALGAGLQTRLSGRADMRVEITRPMLRAVPLKDYGVRYEGRKLLPDVDEACEEVAGAITPRVGGVGPTTIAMLFRNAIEAAERNVQRRAQSGTV